MAATEKVKFTDTGTQNADNTLLQSIRKNAEVINKEPATASEPKRPETATADTGSNATENGAGVNACNS